MLSHLSTTNKAAVLPRLHSSISATTKTFRDPLQTRGYRIVAHPQYYHRTCASHSDCSSPKKSKDVHILDRHRPNFNSTKTTSFASSALKQRQSQVGLKNLVNDSNLAAVYLARATSYTSYTAHPKSSNGYRAARAASRSISKYGVNSQRDSSSYQIPVKKFAGYKPQFSEFQPPSGVTGPPPPAPLPTEPYVTDSELYLDGRTLEEELSAYYKAVRHNEPDGSPEPAPCPIRQALKEYDLKAGPDIYNGFGYNEPDGKPPVQAKSQDDCLKEYEQKVHANGYKSVAWNEPDGLPQEKPSEIEGFLAEYEKKDANAYQSFGYNEPDGKPAPEPSSLEDALAEFDQNDANAYKPFGYNEPDGKAPEQPDQVNEALAEFDQKWEPKIQNDNFFFDEPYSPGPDQSATVAPVSTTKNVRAKQIFTLLDISNKEPLVIRKANSSTPKIGKGRRETAAEKDARRKKLEVEFAKSSVQFVEDIEAVTKDNHSRLVRKRMQELKGIDITTQGDNNLPGAKDVEETEHEALRLLKQCKELRKNIGSQLAGFDTAPSVTAAHTAQELPGTAVNTVTGGTKRFESDITTRREEDVFSGRESRWQKKERRQRKRGVFKRVFTAGLAGAGVFYAAGVVSEFFYQGW